MAAQLTTLLSTQDTFEFVRDRVAQILADEFAAQMVLADEAGEPPSDYDAKIYSERFSPLEDWSAEDKNSCAVPVVSVWFQRLDGDQKGSTVDGQRGRGSFFLDCFAAAFDKNAQGTFEPGDQAARFKLHRVVRLVRQILMSGQYTYLADERGAEQRVVSRFISGIELGPPERGRDEHAGMWIATARITLAVDMRLTQPQVQPISWTGTDLTVRRLADGKVLARGQYDHPAT